MHKTTNIVFIACALFLSGAWAMADQEQIPIDLRFLFLEESFSRFEVTANSDQHSVSSYPYAISPPVAFSTRSGLEVYRSGQPRDESSEPERTRVARLSPPSEKTSVLAVMAPRRDMSGNGDPYGVIFYEDDISSFPVRSVRVINLGKTSIAVALGKEYELLEPGDSKVIFPQPDSKNRIFARVAEWDSPAHPEHWNILYDSVMMLRPGERITGVIVHSPSGLRHTYTADEIADFGEPKPGHFWLTYTDRLSGN